MFITEHGFVGYTEDLLRKNMLLDYTAGETFFTVFGVFFPAATGDLTHKQKTKLWYNLHWFNDTVLIWGFIFAISELNIIVNTFLLYNEVSVWAYMVSLDVFIYHIVDFKEPQMWPWTTKSLSLKYQFFKIEIYT